MGRRKKLSGQMSLALVLYTLLVLSLLLTLSAEGFRGKKMRAEREAMLRFDYGVEGYFLLLASGALEFSGDTAYGRVPGEGLEALPPPGDYVQVTTGEEGIILEGYYQGKLRTTYAIPIP